MKREPSYAMGGKGSEFTLVFDAGARNTGKVEGKVKFEDDRLLLCFQPRVNLLLTDYTQHDAVADTCSPPYRRLAVVRRL